jgi:hypothetical protein
MQTIPWGGAISAVDSLTKLDVRLMVTGHFDGTLANPGAVEALKASILRAVGDAIRAHPRSLMTLTPGPETEKLTASVRAAITPELAQLGAQGQPVIDSLGFDPDSRKRLMEATAVIAKAQRERKLAEMMANAPTMEQA